MRLERQNLLFICSRNQWRSPTAERVFARSPRFAVRSRGLSSSAVRRLNAQDIEWADEIFVMETEHKRRLVQRHRSALQHKRIHVLGIADEYEYMDPELVEQLQAGVESVVGPD